ncbi:MAG TPA: collagen-binding domain-containing protein, partial [Pirellulales bacterium]
MAWVERILAGVEPRRERGATLLHLEALETRDLMAVADPAQSFPATDDVSAYVYVAGAEDEAPEPAPAGLCGAASAPVITGIELEDGGLDDDGVSEDGTIVLLGSAAADATVTITLLGQGVIGTALADANGQWRFDYSATELAEGDYSFIATAPASGPLGIATDFNLFVFDDMSHQYTDVGGRIAVGGNATVTGYGVGTAIGNSNGTRDDFIVGGNLTYSNGQVYSGNVVVGGNANVSSSANILNGSLRQDSVIDFDAAELALQAQSQAYAAIP